MALVVVVVKQAGGGVELDEAGALVAVEPEPVGFGFSAGRNADLHSDGMLAKTLALGPLREQLPGLFASEVPLAIFDQSHLCILSVAHLGSRFFGFFGVYTGFIGLTLSFYLTIMVHPQKVALIAVQKHPGVPALALRAIHKWLPL